MSGRLAKWRQQRRAGKDRLHLLRMLLVAIMPMLWSNDASAENVQEWTSKRGVYLLRFESSLQPIEINRIHTWVIYVEHEGKPVTGAAITADGGMPAHDHGLPTRPRITAELGQGKYRLEGLRFHMSGDWEVTIDISANGKTDTVIVALTL